MVTHQSLKQILGPPRAPEIREGILHVVFCVHALPFSVYKQKELSFTAQTLYEQAPIYKRTI